MGHTDPSHSAAAVRRASELLDIKHVFDSADPGHQTGALERAGHILQAVSRLGTSASDEGMLIAEMALLSSAEFDTPTLAAQGRQRVPPLIQQRPGQTRLYGNTVMPDFRGH